MTADALATACMVTGFKKAKDLVKSLEDVEAYFVHSGKEGNYLEWYTPGFGELLNR